MIRVPPTFNNINCLQFQFGFNMFHEIPTRRFETSYSCYSVSMLPGNERQDVERGGKSMILNLIHIIKVSYYLHIISVIRPPSALDLLTRLNIEYPMIFKLTNDKVKRVTHCGVLEFIADEDKVYLPHWVRKTFK